MDPARPTLSVVIPVFNEEETIPELDRRLRAFLGELGETWEVVFVDDGSRDGSAKLLEALAEKEPRYKLISFGRNFGHQIAITAGMDRAEGEAVVVMDADLQDPPEVVREMLARWRQGFDVVYAVRQRRLGETWFKRLSASIFYRMFRAMLGFDLVADAGDFRLMSRPVVLTLRSLRERHRFIRGLVGWIGFRQSSVGYVRPERFAGVTKYPLRKMLGFAFDGITSFSTLPLRVATWLGAFAALLAMGLGAWAFYVKINGRQRGAGLDHHHDPGRARLVGAASGHRHPGSLRRPHLRGGAAAAALHRGQGDESSRPATGAADADVGRPRSPPAARERRT